MATGQPPWSEYNTPASAMFHIAQTKDYPQLPKWFSTDAKEFLKLCFRSKPSERANVFKLLRHPWMMSALQLKLSKAISTNPNINSRKSSVIS